MRVSHFVAVAAVFTLACDSVAGQRGTPQTPAEVAIKEGERKTSTDPKVNPDAAAMADFEARVKKYADLHKDLAKGNAAPPKETPNPAQITAAKTALAAKIQNARANAKHGDIFTPQIRPVFRRLLTPELKGEDGRDAKEVLKDDAPAPGTVPFKVNAKYPENQPQPTVPANLLLTLPTLPAPLEYRIVGQHLLLLDVEADLIVDYILNAITT
jgi:hypothetical protein